VLAIDVLAFYDGFDSGDDGTKNDSGKQLDQSTIEPGDY